jgi:Kef-type K+ transport system membrane component KefB
MPLGLFWASSETAPLLFQMLLVFGTAKLMGEIFERLNQPAVAGELLAGAILGPGLLGWVQPDAFLNTLGELGVIFLLFQVGLELEGFRLTRVGWLPMKVAIAGVVVPLLAGAATMLAFQHSLRESIFFGSAMVATSVGITAKVLSDMGKLQSVSGKLVLAAAVIDDVLGLLVLAVVSSLALGGRMSDLVIAAALSIGFVLIVAHYGVRAVERYLPLIGAGLRASSSEYGLAMGLLFGLSLLAVKAGVAAIIGAFLAGMALSGTVSRDLKKMTHGVSELFTPFFLAGIGLKLNLQSFLDWREASLLLLLIVVACLSKLVGCGWGALSLGRAEALRVGVGMMPRGEVGMVVAQIGYSSGVISQKVFALTVAMSVATTLLAPPFLRRAYRND